MTSRTSFKFGLTLLAMAVLLLAWNTWCLKAQWNFSGGSPLARLFNEQMAKHRMDDFAITALVTAMTSIGIFYCVDALVWNRSKVQADQVR